MPNLGLPEIIAILAVVLLLFGPKKLPELARGIGQSVREFKKGTQGLKEELEASLKDEPAPVHTANTIAPAQVNTIAPAQVNTIAPARVELVEKA